MDARRKKLLFRSDHRGFKEMDLLMGHFARTHIENMTEDDVTAFEALLEQPDQDVYSWIIGTQPTPDEFDTAVMRGLQDFDLSEILQN